MNSNRDTPVAEYDSLKPFLQGVGLRPTHQRLLVARWLFAAPHKHVTAEAVYAAVSEKGEQISLATVYNTLNGFTKAGLLRQLVMGAGQVFFDTNTCDHYHFFDEARRLLQDVDADMVHVSKTPKLPAGTSLSGIDIVFRVRGCSEY